MEPEATTNYFYINSSDRMVGTATNFIVPHHRFNDSHAYRVSKCILPYTFYNVSSFYNTFSIISGVTTYNITITPGQYTVSDFNTALQTALNALGVGVFTVSIGLSTFKITITNATVPWTYLGTSSSYFLTGFGNSNIGPALSNVAPNLYNFGGTDYIDIVSNTLSKSDSKVIDTGFRSASLIQRIPLSQYSFGQTILFMSRHPHLFTSKINLTEDIDIILIDQWRNNIDLNGRDWTLLLKYFTSKSNDPNSMSRVINREQIKI